MTDRLKKIAEVVEVTKKKTHLSVSITPPPPPTEAYFDSTTRPILSLFFCSYFCLIGPFNHISLYESLVQP